MIWSCPVCSAHLVKQDRSWRCDQGHSFDCAKEGYVNLLLANQKRTAEPGDTREMMIHRRAFLEAGAFLPLSKALNQVIQSLQPKTLLDCGCGEGYYLQQYLKTINTESELTVFGLDISKEAVRMASKTLREHVNFSVASSFHLPVMDASVDLLLRVFAPGDIAEVQRVLTPEGTFVLVVPGANHLFSLKEALYQTPKVHELPPVPEGFVCEREVPVGFDLHLEDNESIRHLLAMTPFVWKGDRKAKEALEKLTRFSTRAEFMIRVYRHHGH